MPVGKVFFIDVTNRDGVQTSRVSLSKFQRTMLNYYLSALGIYQSEFTFPFLKHEAHYLKGNLKLKRRGAFGSMKLSGWCRAVPQDVRDALNCGLEHINVSIATSDQMIINKYGSKRNHDRVVKDMVEAVTLAREGGLKTIGVNAEDASRTELSFLTEFGLAAREAGAARLRYCDTLGYDTPMSIYQRMASLAEALRMDLEPHGHNDLGMAVANSVMGAKGALDAGVNAYVNTVVNGIGERAGQADLLSCILAFRFGNGLNQYSLGNSLNLSMSYKLASYVSYAFGIPIPVNQVGVGANAFAHEAGIHADGALKDRRNYELYDFELLGRGEDERIPTGRVLTTGEFGGLAGFKWVYSQLGITFPDDKIAQRLLELVQYVNAHNQRPLLEEELLFLYRYPDEAREVVTDTPWDDLS